MTSDGDIEAAARAYAAFFERLTPGALGELDTLCAPEVRFRDPFNDVHGLAAVRAVFLKMFEDTVEPKFAVRDVAVAGRVCYLRWRFTFRRPGRGGAPLAIEGMSEIHFDARGRVCAHLDHWDPSPVYETVPGLGAVVRFVKRRLRIAAPNPFTPPPPD